MKFEEILTFASKLDLSNNAGDKVIAEFTSERDLAYYLIISILMYKDYKHIIAENT